MTELTVESRSHAAGVVMALTGELDMATTPQVERELARHAPGSVVLDLRGLTFLDSSGVRVVIAAHLDAERAGERLLVVRGPRPVQRVFAIAGLEGRLHFVDDAGDEPLSPVLEAVLERGENAPAAARDVLTCLAGHIGATALDDVRLLVSELVTNSVRHARTDPLAPIVLRVVRSGGGLRVEVTDPAPEGGAAGAPTPRTPGLDGTGGFGLFLVDRLADRWGSEQTGSATVVWFELDAERAA